MKKLCFCMSIFFMLLGANAVSAESVSETLRIGLESKYRNVSSVPISNKSLILGVGIEDNFYECGTVFGDNLSVGSASAYYLKSSEVFSDYNSAASYAETVNGIPALTNMNVWNVYFAGYSNEGEAEQTKKGAVISIKANENAVVLCDGGVPKVVFDSGSFAPQVKGVQNDFVNLNGTGYRGAVEFMRKSNGITAVNVVTVDEYLYGVVSSEMPSEWHKEALKAQAVACRNYIMFTREKHFESGYNLCDSSHCQAYKGTAFESENSIEAVDETSGKYIYYNGEIINAVYHSSSGGYTAASEDVWGTPTAYLQPVEEINEREGKVWTRVFSLGEITELLNLSGTNIGSAVNVYISSTASSGRVNALTIVGTNGTKVLEKESIRTFFASAKGGSLESRNFIMGNSTVSEINTKISAVSSDGINTVELNNMTALNGFGEKAVFNGVNSNAVVIGKDTSKNYNVKTVESTVVNTEPGTVSFSGKGWGHGVGMSQFGAKGMAEQGYGYEEILKHYYTGTYIGN